MGALTCASAAVLTQAQKCAPPDEFKPKLQQKVSAETLADLGAWFGNHEQYECAAEALASSLQMDPTQKDAPHVVFLFGASLYYAGNLPEATSAFQEAEKLGYRHERLYSLLAAGLDTQKRYDAAATEWRKALEFEPESTEALDALSNDLIALRRFDECIALLESPRLLAHRSAAQYLNLDLAYTAVGQLPGAAATLQEGWNTYPASSEIAQRLSKSLEKLGRPEEASLVRKIASAQ